MTVYTITAVNPREGPIARAAPCVGAACRYQGRVCRSSPHLLSNPTDKENQSPAVLPPEAKRLWDRTYANADRYYQGAWDMPQMAAWRAVKMRYPNGTGNWRPGGQSSLVRRLKRNRALAPNEYAPPPQTIRLPDPGETTVLGRALEYVNIESPPGLDVYRFKDEENAPKLLWSPRHRALLIFPTTEIPDELDPDLTGLDESVRVFNEFHWGQKARGFSPFKVEDWEMVPVGMTDTVVYRSGKGTEVRDDPVGVQEYVHQHGDGVVTYVSKATDRNGTPRAIMIRGGSLDVIEPGIVN